MQIVYDVQSFLRHSAFYANQTQFIGGDAIPPCLLPSRIYWLAAVGFLISQKVYMHFLFAS